MKKFVKILSGFLLTLFVISITAFIFFTYTSSGLNALIYFSAAYFNQTISAKEVQGRLLDHAQIKELNYHYNDLNIKAKNVSLNWTINSLWQANVLLRDFHADSIEVTQQDTLITAYDVEGTALITQEQISIHSFRFNYLGLTVVSDLQLKPQYPYTFNSAVRLRSLTKINTLPQGILTSAGDINLINWSGDFNGPGSISLQGSLSHLNQLEQVIKWRDLIWPNTRAQEILSKEGRISINGNLPQLKIDLNSKFNRTTKEQWQINGQIQGKLPLTWHFQFNAMHTINKNSKNEGLYTSFTLNGLLTNPYNADLNITSTPGFYQVSTEDKIHRITFQEGLINAHLSSKGIQAKGALNLDTTKKLSFNFTLPHFNLAEGLTKKQTFSAHCSLKMNSLDFLANLIPELKNPQGTLNLFLNAHGEFKKAIIESKLVLNKGKVELPNLGITLNSIEAALTGKKDKWEGNASIRVGNQPLVLKGHGLLLPQPTADINLEGNNVPIITSNEYQITSSPKLQIKYARDLLEIMGSILIPLAKIKIQSFSNSIGLSNDVIFESKEKTPSSPIRSQIEVQIATGKQVELNAKGLHALLAGTVNVKQTPEGPMLATGELNVVKGEYKAYGQNLKIEQGELFFTGGAIDNPGINLRASKTINTSANSNINNNEVLEFNDNLQNANLRGSITVGVEVTGRLVNPEIKLFSTPAILSQADILSMMVLGRPASQANKSGAQLLLAAVSSMNIGNNIQGTQLLEQLKQNLGVDFNVETNSNYNLLTNQVSDKTAFVVSKSLSKRISLSYNVGLSQTDSNVVTLKYLLSKFFSIQVSTSNSNSGIDVLYTSSKK